MNDVAAPLLSLLSLEEKAFAAMSERELTFVMVNETHGLVPYRQAAFFASGRGVMAVSGVSAVEPDAPFTLWLARLFRAVEAGDAVGPEQTPDWGDWLPRHVLWLPVRAPGDGPVGTLMLAADAPWTEAGETLLRRLVAAYGVAWAAHHKPGTARRLREALRRVPRWRWIAAAAVALVLAVPVRLSVLAPAEVVPRDPAVVRAPADGVVEAVRVQPNAPVTTGEVLFDMDQTAVGGQLEVAVKALSTAQAELDQATQQAFAEVQAIGRIAVLQARVAERRAEVARLESLLERTRVRAPVDGVAVLDAPSEWAGRPVAVGEKVLAVADPGAVEVEAWLAPADVIDLDPGAPVVLFLNTAPLDPVRARLSYVAYKATQQPDGLMAHRVRAELAEGAATAPPRLGLKGTARLDGRRVPLGYLLARRPLAVIRQWIGV